MNPYQHSVAPAIIAHHNFGQRSSAGGPSGPSSASGESASARKRPTTRTTRAGTTTESDDL
jgi:hypothetical protein